MARAKSEGNGKLEEAMTALVQAQAIMVQTQASYLAQKSETDKRIAETDKEIAALRKESIAIEKKMAETTAEFELESRRLQHQNDERFERIEALLIEHSRNVRGLSDVIRDKIGFKPSGTQPSETPTWPRSPCSNLRSRSISAQSPPWMMLCSCSIKWPKRKG